MTWIRVTRKTVKARLRILTTIVIAWRTIIVTWINLLLHWRIEDLGCWVAGRVWKVWRVLSWRKIVFLFWWKIVKATIDELISRLRLIWIIWRLRDEVSLVLIKVTWILRKVLSRETLILRVLLIKIILSINWLPGSTKVIRRFPRSIGYLLLNII